MSALMDPILTQYILDLFAPQDEALRKIHAEIPEKGLPTISVHPEEGRFLQFLMRACRVAKAIEIGTLNGYSGVWIARGLAPGGKLITIEKEPERAELSRQNFVLAGVEQLVEIRLGEAQQILQELEKQGPYDFVFIDADKFGYPSYFDWALENVRQGGLIAAHNAFRKGSVAGLKEPDPYTQTIQAFNLRVAHEPRVISTVYPGGDGTLLAVKMA